MDLLDKILNELSPYFATEKSSLWYFLFLALGIIVLHCLFARYRFIKYLPGLTLLIIGVITLFFNKSGGFLRSSVEDLRKAVLCGATGLSGIFFARIIGIMYKRSRHSKARRPKTSDEYQKRNIKVE